MKCPNCGKDISGSARVCPSCGFSAGVADKIYAKSRLFYNKGLVMAGAGNMTASITALKSAVGFDKEFTDARNLLGLAYYNVGLVGEAVSQWLTSVYYDGDENNAALRYITEIKRNPREFERLKDSVKSYNSALYSLKQHGDDMARIQLKKALEANPNFVDAMNLLALCHMGTEQREKALKYVERALSVDSGNELSLRYLKMLTSRRTAARVADSPPQIIAANDDGRVVEIKKDLYDKSPRSSGVLSGIAALFIAVICVVAGCAVTGFITWKAADKKAQSAIADKDDELAAANGAIDRLSAENDGLVAIIGGKDGEIASLRGEIADVNGKWGALKAEVDALNNERKVTEIESLSAAGQFDRALAAANAFGGEGFSAEQRERVAAVKYAAVAALGAESYAKGKDAYNNKRYDDAKSLLARSIDYAADLSAGDAPYAGDAYYFLGRAFMALGDNASAHPYFVKVVEQYKDSLNYSNALIHERNTRPKQ